MNDQVRITDVSPRDGLQAEAAIIDTAAKAQLAMLVQKIGVAEVEVSSFVRIGIPNAPVLPLPV